MLQRYIFILAFCSALMAGCLPSPYYQKQYSIPQNAWKSQFQPSFKFEVSDTAARYDLSFLVRHTEAYAYSNIWIFVYLKQPGADSFQRTRIEIPLAEPSGKWMGRGMGEIWEQSMPIAADDNAMVFNKKGTYEIKLEQNMRIDPLPEVLQVGLRVEKKPRK
jgi:gliding motility-associated lipoprotein GldH